MRALSLSSRTRSAAPALALLLLSLAASACSPEYEVDRPGTWRATGVNEHNLRAMIADPRDLEAGAGSATERGDGAARAVTRLLIDRRRPLLNTTISRLSPTSDAAEPALPSGGGSPAPGGAAPSAP